MSERLTVLGLPTDRNSSYLRGPAQAPAVIREAMFSDMGHLTSEHGFDLSADFAGFRDVPLEENDRDHYRIEAAAAAAFGAGPALFVGGDHYVTWPILSGLKSARVGLPLPHIVHFDAHSDTYPDYGGNRYSHASPFARILEAGLCASLTQIGVRTLNAVQREQVERYDIQVFSPDEVDVSLGRLPADGEVYVSFDLDGLDPAYAPGVSHHEPGGLTVRQALWAIHACPGRVIGADVVEYNPDRDINGMTAAVCVKLMKELGSRMLFDRDMA